ncbi:MAG: sigma-54-dependent transcriptional regulator [Methyloceanibacter sp.]
MPKRVLVVDDDPSQRHFLEEAIKRFGYHVASADSGEGALAALAADGAGDIALVLLDLVMPDVDGPAVLSAMRALPRRPPVIVQADADSIDAAIAAMQGGAADFVLRPVSPERLDVSIKNALKIEALAEELVRIKASAKGALGFADLIASGEAMIRVLELGKRAAGSTLPVLIEGEPGVGKELIARAIHGESARRSGPFVTVNCGAIPESGIETMLFGAEMGAGKFAEADHGTLFIDEVGDLPLEAQAKLLGALEAGEAETNGSKRAAAPGMRLIAATNCNLIDLVNDGSFREDLYYRLNVFPIWVPPLRTRREDVPELVRHFIARFAAEEGKRIDGLGPDAAALLQRYNWPGNIRQLENAVYRAVVLADSPALTVNEFPQIAAHVEGYAVTVPPAPAPKNSLPRFEGPAMLGQVAPATISLPQPGGRDAIGIPALSETGDIRPLEAIEADMIRLAIGRYRGRMTEIARRLGIGRSTLYRKMREIGIEARAN